MTETTVNGARTLAPRTPGRVGQATAVEQSRAVAEVQAAIVVAQQCPRNPVTAGRAAFEACQQRALAERAFFRYPRGKDDDGKTLYVTGPSVQLARELARCWGNVQYGIAELRRDDDYGQSEMIAFAWDVQTNARASTAFIVPHRRDTKKGVRQLTDLRDVYENNANNGARRVREMIFAVLPVWLVEDAIDTCNQTLASGGGRPLAQRLADALRMFSEIGVSEAQLAAKMGRPSPEWTDHDAAQLSVIYRSIKRGEASKDDEFPAAGRVSAEDITAPPQAPAEPSPGAPVHGQPKPAGKAAQEKLAMLLQLLDLGPEEDVTALIHRLTSPQYSATVAEVRNVTTYLEDHLEASGGDVDKARAAIWEQHKAAQDRG